MIFFSKGLRAAMRVGINPIVFSNMLRNSRKMGERVSALKYVLRPSLRCCKMPLCSSELSSRCKLDGRVWRNPASSDRYHHFSGRVRVAASTPCRTLGNRLSSVWTLLRIMRILLRNMRTLQVLELQLQRQLDRARAADLVERVESAEGPT